MPTVEHETDIHETFSVRGRGDRGGDARVVVDVRLTSVPAERPSGVERRARMSIIGEFDGDIAVDIVPPFVAAIGAADRIIVDLSAVSLLDSAGLRALERLARMFPVEFTEPSSIVRRVVEVLRSDASIRST